MIPYVVHLIKEVLIQYLPVSSAAKPEAYIQQRKL